MLPDRTADTLKARLDDLPGVENVRPDRADAYADAVRTVRPDATQAAKRFPLGKNLCEAVEECVGKHRKCPRRARQGHHRRHRRREGHPQIRADAKPAPDNPKEPTIQKTTRLITAHRDKIDENSALKRKHLMARCPDSAAVADCPHALTQMMTKRRGSDPGSRLTRAVHTGPQPLWSLARGLGQDPDAVAPDSPWNGAPARPRATSTG